MYASFLGLWILITCHIAHLLLIIISLLLLIFVEMSNGYQKALVSLLISYLVMYDKNLRYEVKLSILLAMQPICLLTRLLMSLHKASNFSMECCIGGIRPAEHNRGTI